MKKVDLSADELKSLARLARFRAKEPSDRFDGSGWTAADNNAWCDLLKSALEFQGYNATYSTDQ